MKQIVFIHGGETFASYEDYLAALKSWTFDPTKQHQKRWRDSLAEHLGQGWDVIIPTMPDKYNAKYLEWKIWFEKVLPYVKDGAVFIGHSLGGIFLAKYLAENNLSIKAGAVFLVAAPFDAEGVPYTLADFALPPSLAPMSAQVSHVFLYQSKDDPVVPFANVEKYRLQFPEATIRIFEDRGHFMQEEFPELLADIKELGREN